MVGNAVFCSNRFLHGGQKILRGDRFLFMVRHGIESGLQDFLVECFFGSDHIFDIASAYPGGYMDIPGFRPLNEVKYLFLSLCCFISYDE